MNDEWHTAVRSMSEFDRTVTDIDLRTADGLNGYAEAGDDW